MVNKHKKYTNALILGGTSGIGLATKQRFEELGIKTDTYGSELKLENYGNLANLTEKYDIIVHSVGTFQVSGKCIIKPFAETSYEEYKYCMDLMMGSAYETAQLALRTLNKGGHLVYIGSSSVAKGRKGFSVYSPPKAALNNFVEAISEEFSDFYVNCINPSRTRTKMRDCITDEDSIMMLEADDVANKIVDIIMSDANGSCKMVRVGD